MERIPIGDIITDGMQMRAEMRQEIVEEYAALYEEGAKFPPVRVMRDRQGRNWLVDGFHRVAAAIRLGKVRIRAEVEYGEQTDALWSACAANSSHGLRLSNEDKRRAVEAALELHPEKSAEDIARHVGVSRRFVFKVKAGNPPAMPPETPPSLVNKLQPEPPETPPQVVTCSPVATPSRPSTEPPSLVNKLQPEPLPQVKTGVDGIVRRVPQRVPEKQVDANGREIPPEALDSWNRRGEITSSLKTIGYVYNAARKAQADQDALWQGVNINALMIHLDAARAQLAALVPYAVCPYCQGIGCKFCAGTGMVSKWRWKQVPREIRGEGVEEDRRGMRG